MPTRSEPAIRSSTSASSPSAFVTSGSATTSSSPSPVRVNAYVTSGWAATAVLLISVQGVVVQTSRAAPRSASGPEVTGSFT